MAASLLLFICCCWSRMFFCARAFHTTSFRQPIRTMAPRVTAAKTKQATDDGDDSIASHAQRQSTRRKRAAPTDPSSTFSTITTISMSTPADAPTDTAAAKKTKAPAHQVVTDRDEIPKLWDEQKAHANGSYSECFAMLS